MAGGYPPGAENDSSAPYNQKEWLCPKCGGTGTIEETDEDGKLQTIYCPHCDGTGYDQEYWKT